MKVLKTVVKIVGIVATIASFIPGPHQPIAMAVAAIASAASVALEMAFPTRRPRPTARGSPTEYRLDPNAGIPYMVGRTQYAGTCVKRETWGTDNKWQGFTSVYSYGPIQAYEVFTADRAVINFDGTGQATNPSLIHDIEGDGQGPKNFMYLSKQLGLCPSPVLDIPIADGPYPGWTANSKMSGLAASHWILRFDPMGKLFTGGPPTPGIVAQGVKVYDPRLDSTQPGGSGACRALNESTYVYSETPHLHALTYALGRYQNGKKRMGIGFPADAIDMAYFKNAANIDEANGWKVGGVFFSTDGKWNTLKWLMEAGGASPIQLGGKLSGVQSTPRTSINTITRSDVLGRSSIAATRSMRERVNTAIPRYRSEPHGWEYVSAAPVRIASYVTADGGERTREYEYTLVQQVNQASQLAAYELYNAREFGPIELTLKTRWIGLKPGDCVTLNIPDLNLNNQRAIVIARSLEVATGAVSLKFMSETDAKHAAALGMTGVAPPVPSLTYTPDFDPAPPTAPEWTLSSGLLQTSGGTVPSLRFQGSATLLRDGVTGIEFSYLKVGSTDPWTVQGIYAANTARVDISAVEPGSQYYGRVRYKMDKKFSDYIQLGPITVQSAAASTASIASSIVGQGALATQNSADWATQIGGGGKPSDNAGTSGLLVPIGNYSFVQGNSVQKRNPGTHGAFEGGARGSPQFGASFITSSILSPSGGTWQTWLALDDDPTTFLSGDQKYLALYSANGTYNGDVALYIDGAMYNATIYHVPLITDNSRLSLVYDENKVSVMVDGVVYVSAPAPRRLVLYPKVIDFYRSELLSSNNKITDVLYGPLWMMPDLNGGIVDSGSVTPTIGVPRNEVRTPLGTAAAIAGQGTGATANNLSQLNSAEGTKLTGIETAADVTRSITGPTPISINYSSDGVTPTDTMPKLASFRMIRNGVDVTEAATWTTAPTITLGSGVLAVSDTAGTKGRLSVTSMATGSITVRITAVHNGITAALDVTITKNVAAPPATGGGGSGGSTGTAVTDTTLNQVSSTSSSSPTVISDELTVTMASGVTTADLTAYFEFASTNSGAFVSCQLQAKWQWWNGSSYVDISGFGYVAGDPSYSHATNPDGEFTYTMGVMSVVASKGGLSGTQKFRLVAYKSSGSTGNVTCSGTATADGT